MGYETYVGISREQLLVKMQHLLPEKRFKHCLGVEQAAIDLAERFGVDVEKAGLAGLLHDYAKKLSDEEFLALIDKYALDPALKDWGNNVWHIEVHTVGSAQMSDLDKVVYVADYIEPNRNFPGVEQAREIAKKSLNKAVAYETARTVEHLAHKGLPIFPQTIETYNAYVGFMKDDK